MERQTDVRRARIRFAVVFAVVGGALLTLYSFPYAEHGVREDWFASYLALYARLAGLVLRIFDSGVRVVGNDIVGRTSLTVAKNCDAMDVTLLFAAAVVAFPARWSRRLIGIAAGVAALAIVNVLRIASLYFVGLRWPSAFETIHAEVWPLAIVVLAATAFLAWSRWAQAPAATTAETPTP
jgi:exosortase H (IPTLxxWG-CTERM-specific)